MATGQTQFGYIPPHERTDKLLLPQPLQTNTEPAFANITVRKSLAGDNIQKSIAEMLDEEDPNPPHPTLVGVLASLNDKMTEQITRLKRMDLSAVNTNKSLQFTQDNLNDLKVKVEKLEHENENLKKENDKYHSMSRDMDRRIEIIEQRLEQNDHALRRKNILIEGAPHTAGENVLDIAIDIMAALKPGISSNDFEFVQRVNKPGGKKPILIVFKSVNDRDEILSKKKDLKEKPNLRAIWLNEDANPTIRKQKNECRAVVREAQKQGLNAKQRGNGIVLDSVYYAHNSLNKLPQNISLASTRTRVNDTAVGFAGPQAELSNMHQSPYTYKGVDYKTVEHGHSHSKAKYAQDEKSAQAILDTKSPYTAKSIAKEIHAPGWEGIELTNLKDHMREKYLQNKRCMQALMETGTKKLLELTWDRKWAAGYGPYSRQFDKNEQPGQNLTGYALEELRTEFRGAILPQRQSTPPQRTRKSIAAAVVTRMRSTTGQSEPRGDTANTRQEGAYGLGVPATQGTEVENTAGRSTEHRSPDQVKRSLSVDLNTKQEQRPGHSTPVSQPADTSAQLERIIRTSPVTEV